MQMQLTINSFRQLFFDKIFFLDSSLTFSKIPDISLTAVKFPGISRFSRQVVTMINVMEALKWVAKHALTAIFILCHIFFLFQYCSSVFMPTQATHNIACSRGVMSSPCPIVQVSISVRPAVLSRANSGLLAGRAAG